MVAELDARLGAHRLPTDDSGAIDVQRVQIALEEATGIIVSHLPWLLDETTGEIALPLPAQFADSLLAICSDIAFYRLSDSVSSSEDDRERYKSNLKLLDTISIEHQGGLKGPDLQEASLVEPNEEAGIHDVRFFKKGELG